MLSHVSLQAAAFTEVAFETLVGELAGRGGKATTQTSFLGSFLQRRDPPARGMVCETPYVDRHFMEEHSAYYAASFRSVPNHTSRIHLLSERLAQVDLEALLRRAALGPEDFDAVRSELEQIYLGFVVIRPIPDAPIGRTVLKPYQDRNERVFTTARPLTAHLAGIPLELEGVPFQQQEVAVGACATTAIWSALASASRNVGSRGPTPLAVTLAATKRLLNDRPMPAEGGLDFQQIVGSIHELGFAPYAMRASQPEFDIFVRCYLASGFPVILIVQDGAERHAVTAVGFRRGDGTLESSDGQHVVTSLGMEKIYIHEDRLGPYARMRWSRPSEAAAGDADARITHEPYEGARYAYTTAGLRVTHGIVPLYPKIRLSARGLLDVAAGFQPWLRHQFPAERVRVELTFVPGHRYLSDLMQTGLQPADRAAQITRLCLPRWVGVVRCMNSRNEAFLDLVCDTTDIFRQEPMHGALIAGVALVPEMVDRLKTFAKTYELAARVVVI